MPDYPGLGLPLRHQLPAGTPRQYPSGAHHGCPGSDSDMLFVREVGMMIIMDQLTDKPDWHKKVFDDTIVEKWRKEALEYPDKVLWSKATGRGGPHGTNDAGQWQMSLAPLTGIISEEAFHYCVQELRSKARYYEQSQITPTLDASFCVAKSDVMVPNSLRDSLRQAILRLKEDQGANPDWHPGSNDMVQDLVHPSMYPLVYATTKAHRDEVVGVSDAIDKWSGTGETIPWPNDTTSGDRGLDKYWSDKYQWLPANMAFGDDESIKFASYINNLHPQRFPEIYCAIENFVEKVALPMWDQCLYTVQDGEQPATEGQSSTSDGPGRRKGQRIPVPEHHDDEDEENWEPDQKENDATNPMSVVYQHVKGVVAKVLGSDIPEGASTGSCKDESDEDSDYPSYENRTPVQPRPAPYTKVNYTPKTRLADKYKDRGLQVIVKMVSIELTPNKPEFPAGKWHVEGQMNEHIVGTALYYIDSENITPSQLSFRVQTAEDEWPTMFTVGQDQYHWLEKVYGVALGGGSGDPCLQHYGSVQTPEGRVLAFPNVFQHRVSGFKLADPTKPGYRRFLALWLVDPNLRIISTANVPPQRQDWWLDSVLGTSPEARQQSAQKLPPEVLQLLREKGALGDITVGPCSEDRLPPELFERIRTDFKVELMTEEQAKDHREKLMKVRTAFQDEARKDWDEVTYNFCEH